MGIKKAKEQQEVKFKNTNRHRHSLIVCVVFLRQEIAEIILKQEKVGGQPRRCTSARRADCSDCKAGFGSRLLCVVCGAGIKSHAHYSRLICE